MRTVIATVFFIAEECNDEFAMRFVSRPQNLSDGGEDHGVHVLHVNRSATPEHSVANLAGKRINRPVCWVYGNDIEVTVDNECWQFRVGARNPSNDGRTAGCGVDVVRLEPERFEKSAHIAGCFGFGISFSVSPV